MNRAFICVAALVLPLGLAGCGVKGPLEPPPNSGLEPHASAAPATQPASPDSLAAARAMPGSRTAVATTPSGASAAVIDAPAAQRRSALDWLID